MAIYTVTAVLLQLERDVNYYVDRPVYDVIQRLVGSTVVLSRD